jgi:proteasome beta subunit
VSERPSLPVSGASFGANPSFLDLLRREAPDAVPGALRGAPGARADGRPESRSDGRLDIPQGTTVLGLIYADGVMVAGDRRATSGYTIADDKMRKVFAADDYSAIAIAGAAGMAIEMVKLFQLELEHYEKLTGDRLSLEGKANRLAQMIRSNFPLAMQGLVVVPLFGGYDQRRSQGRLFYYDATGGRWEEDDYQSTGSGSQPAKNSLKKRWKPGLDRTQALRVAVEALLDASEEDVATGGPNPGRQIFPVILAVTVDGAAEVPEDEVASAVAAVLEERAR